MRIWPLVHRLQYFLQANLEMNLQIFVIRIGFGAARVADLRSQNTVRRAEQRIGSPKAAHAECGRFVFNIKVVQ